MKYDLEIAINLPREEVVAKFDNPDNMKQWQPGLQSFEHISGTPGQPGAKSRIKYDMGKRKVEIIETIEVRDLPNEFTGTFEAKGVWNRVENYFEEDVKDRTIWRTKNEFKCKGMIRIMAALMPSAFKKQSYKYMTDFKVFAESEEN